MKAVVPIGPSPTEKLKTGQATSLDQEKTRLKKATKEFEAFFRYQMLKAMRKTVPKNPLTEGMSMSDSQGQDTFVDMMDMELSKAGIGGPGSLSDILYKNTEKLLEAKYASKDMPAGPIQFATSRRPMFTVKKPAIKLETEKTPLPLETKPKAAPLPAREPTPHQRIMTKFGEHIEAAAKETELDTALIASVIKAESGGNPNAQSHAGAKGLMQLADSTAHDYGVTDAFDPEQNIKAGSRFLKSLMDKYQDVKLALAAYNAGPRNVDKYGGLPPFKETREYVDKVMAFFEDLTGE